MSLKTWKKQYYPEDASIPKTKLEALEHSLRKWRGLLPGALKKHGCRVETNSFISDGDETWVVDGTSCALCFKYFSDYNGLAGSCYKCPLCQLLGNRCDTPEQPWIVWLTNSDARPMVAALKTLVLQERKAKAKKEEHNGRKS